MRSARVVSYSVVMETETNVGGAHRADRPELSAPNPGNLRVNPWVSCANLYPDTVNRHAGVCPHHHPWVYSKIGGQHRGVRRQAVTA